MSIGLVLPSAISIFLRSIAVGCLLVLAIGFGQSECAPLPAQITLNVPVGSEASPIKRIYGAFPSAYLGQAMTYGDVNGDGFQDAVIAEYHASPGGRTNAGTCNIIYGSPDLDLSEIDLRNSIGTYNETRIHGDNADDNTGWSVACGDINGDSFADVVIGSYDPYKTGRYGLIYVIYGSAQLPGNVLDLSQPSGTYQESRILGKTENDKAGLGVAVSDLNADGYEDVVIGAPGTAVSGKTAAGAVYILWGSPSRLPLTVNLQDPLGTYNETVIYGGQASGGFGQVAAADVNGDGYGDIIGTAIGLSPAGGQIAGGAFVIYGSASLPGTTVNLASAAGTYGETRIYGDNEYEYLGLLADTGDFNGDGYSDMIFTANPSVFNQGPGKAYVIYGAPNLPGKVIDLNSAPGSNRETRFAARNLWFSMFVGSPDMNGDGVTDIAFGGVNTPIASSTAGSTVYLQYGTATLPRTSINYLNTTADIEIYGENGSDAFGAVGSGMGDLNGDGFSDLLMAAQLRTSPSSPSNGQEGTVYCLFGGGQQGSSATLSRFQVTGDGTGSRIVPACDFGPVGRMKIDFSDDDIADNGNGRASQTTVSLRRTRQGISNLGGALPSTEIAETVWHVTTDRINWTSATLILKYTKADIQAISGTEGDLAVFNAPSANGPWAQIPTVIDPARNTATVQATELGFFALANQNTVPVELSHWAID